MKRLWRRGAHPRPVTTARASVKLFLTMDPSPDPGPARRPGGRPDRLGRGGRPPPGEVHLGRLPAAAPDRRSAGRGPVREAGAGPAAQPRRGGGAGRPHPPVRRGERAGRPARGAGRRGAGDDATGRGQRLPGRGAAAAGAAAALRGRHTLALRDHDDQLDRGGAPGRDGQADVAIVSTDRAPGPDETTLCRQRFHWVAPRAPRGKPQPIRARLAREPCCGWAPAAAGGAPSTSCSAGCGLRPLSTIDVRSVSLMLAYVAPGAGHRARPRSRAARGGPRPPRRRGGRGAGPGRPPRLPPDPQAHQARGAIPRRSRR